MTCSHFLAIITNDAINICVQVFVWAYFFSYFGYIPTSSIAGSNGNSWLTFWGTARDVSSELYSLDLYCWKNYICPPFNCELFVDVFLSCWGSSLIFCLLRVFIMKKHWTLSNVFSTSFMMIMWILFLIVLTWYFTLKDIQILNQPCIFRMSGLFQARTAFPRGGQGVLSGRLPC